MKRRQKALLQPLSLIKQDNLSGKMLGGSSFAYLLLEPSMCDSSQLRKIAANDDHYASQIVGPARIFMSCKLKERLVGSQGRSCQSAALHDDASTERQYQLRPLRLLSPQQIPTADAGLRWGNTIATACQLRFAQTNINPLTAVQFHLSSMGSARWSTVAVSVRVSDRLRPGQLTAT